MNNNRILEKRFPRHFHTEKPVSAKITSNTMLHERKHCNYCQEKHLNNMWLNITATITSKKVSDFDGTLD